MAGSQDEPTGLAGITGADWDGTEGTTDNGGRGGDVANAGTQEISHIDLADVYDAAPVRSVAQVISCRPEDVRKPSKGNSVHKGFAGNPDGTRHHNGSHHDYMANKIQKLSEQYDEGKSNPGNNKGVFHNVGIHVNGITHPSWLELRDLMLANGGRFCNYYSRATTTHIVCARLTNAKLAAFKKADRNHPPIVTPEWVVESLRVGKLLPCAQFALQGTLEPGQKRINSAFAVRKALGNADQNGDATDSEAEDDIAPTQEDAVGGEDAVALDEMDTEAKEDGFTNKNHLTLRVVFNAARHHLESLPVGDDDAKASTSFDATRAASAAAYAALTSTVYPSRIIPVSAWEALVVCDEQESNSKNENLLAEEAENLAMALVAAGVDACAAPVNLRVLDNDVVPVVLSPVADPFDGISHRVAATKRKRSMLKNPEEREGDTHNPSGKRKSVQWVGDVDVTFQDVPEPRDASTRQKRYRSSFAASAAAPDPSQIKETDWDALPPDLRRRMQLELMDPTTSDSQLPTTNEPPAATYDAFHRTLGMKPKTKGKAGGSKAASTNSNARPKRTEPRDLLGLPGTFEEIDPEYLKAIGTEEADKIREHYKQLARRQQAKVRQTKTKGKKAAQKASEFFKKASEKNTEDAHFENMDVDMRDDDDDDAFTHVPSTDTPSSLYAEIRDEATIDAICASLETAVDALVDKVEDTGENSEHVLDLEACASVLQDQAVALVESGLSLEWVQRIMRAALELCEKSERHTLFWRPLFDKAWAEVSKSIEEEYEGASLVLSE